MNLTDQREQDETQRNPEPKRRVKLGDTGEKVRERVAHWRKVRRYTLVQLSDRMTEVGNAMAVGTLSEIERGARRVDVDDLTALAAALDVDVLRLLGARVELDDDPGLSDEAQEIIDAVTALDRRLFQAELAADPDAEMDR